MNLIILNATFIFNILFSVPAIYQGWPEVGVCVEDMQNLSILHYRNGGGGGVVSGNLKMFVRYCIFSIFLKVVFWGACYIIKARFLPQIV